MKKNKSKEKKILSTQESLEPDLKSPPGDLDLEKTGASGVRFFFALTALGMLACHLLVSRLSYGQITIARSNWLGWVSVVFLVASGLFLFLAIIAPIFSSRPKSKEDLGDIRDKVPDITPPLSGDPALAFLMHDLPVIAFRLNQSGRIMAVSQVVSLLVGRKRELLEGADPLDLVIPDDRSGFREYINMQLGREHVRAIEVAFPAESKKRVVRFGEESLLLSNSAGENEIVIAGFEITELKEALESSAELKGKLGQAAKLEELGLLAGGVAHDIKNIINPMLAYPEVLLKQIPQNSDLREPILKIRSSATRARDAILNFLSLARRGRFEPSPVDMNAIISEFLSSNELEELKQNKPEIKVIFEPGTMIPMIDGAAVQLNNVVMNLVRNAFEATKSNGQIKISTSLINLEFPHRGYQQVPRGTYVLLSIADQGKGMEPEVLEHLFDPFFSRKKMGRSGTGLGMAVVEGVVEDHGGYLDVKSVLEKGTTFSIYLPCSADSFKNSEDEPEKPLALVIDQDYDARFQAKTDLNRMGYQVITAGIFEEGIRKAASGQPTLIILDLTGIEREEASRMFSSSKRALGKGGSLLLTGAIPDGFDQGHSQTISKPIVFEELSNVIRSLTEKLYIENE